MSEIGYFVFDGSDGKEISAYGDDKGADLSPQDATALAMIYLSERLAVHFDRLHDRLQEICDKIGDTEAAAEALGARLDDIEGKIDDLEANSG